MNDRVFRCSHRLQRVQQPIIPQVAAWINATPGTLSLGQGVVYYPPPEAALRSATNSDLDQNYHVYGDVAGSAELRQAISSKLLQDNQVSVNDTQRIIVTAGSNMAFLNALLAITDAGDEVILLRPYYFNHEMAVTMLDCMPVCIDCDEDYQPILDSLDAAISERTRAVVTVSPNNPTGAVYKESTLKAINQLCKDRGLYHISDEAYEYFTYDGTRHFSPASISGADEHTISLFSLSKAYGFASWRIGYMLIPEHLKMAVTKVQDTNLICAARVSQDAALAAITEGRRYCDKKRESIESVRTTMLDAFADITDICQLTKTSGAFYFLVRCQTELSALAVVQRLIEEHGIAVIPGETFGLNEDCYLRIAYGALTPEQAAPAIERLITGLKTIIT